MPQRDFMMREIEKIGAMLRMLIRRRFEQKDTKDGEEEIAEIAEGLALESNVQLEELIDLKKEEFDAYFEKQTGFNADNLEMLADLLAHISEFADQEKSIKYKQKAIELYTYIDETEKTFSMQRMGKVQRLQDR